MAKDSKRVRHLRRVKRSNTLRGQQLDLQQAQMQQLVGMLVKQREELTTLKAVVEGIAGGVAQGITDVLAEPSFIVTTLPDEGVTLADDMVVPDDDNYYPADDQEPDTLADAMHKVFDQCEVGGNIETIGYMDATGILTPEQVTVLNNELEKIPHATAADDSNPS
jgi:hypothetical protein